MTFGDNQFYPRTGTLADVVGDFFQGTLGSDFSYHSYAFAFNKYSGISARQVLAFRVFGCATSGRVPFYDLCLLGMHNDVRGYETGRYQDRLMLTSQVEYRRELPKRFGFVAFFGLGEVAPEVGKFNADNLKPAGGRGCSLHSCQEKPCQFSCRLRNRVRQRRGVHGA